MRFLLSKGTYKTIDFPEAASTVCKGINNGGQIAGLYLDTDGNLHGFLKVKKNSTNQNKREI